MSSSESRSLHAASSTRPTGGKALTPDPLSLNADVDCASQGTAVTLGVQQVDASVTHIQVKWNGTTVYDSYTPNAPGQFSIAATFVDGQTCTIDVLIWYAGWSRPSVYETTVVARNGLQTTLTLPRTSQGGA